MEALADWLTLPGVGAFVRSSNWVWPIGEIFHYLGMALLLGTVGFLDLRILGLGKGIPMRALSKLVPLGVLGFALNLITGLMFVTGNPLGKPIDYFTNLAFELKMLLILLAGLNLIVFYVAGISRRIDALPADADAPAAAKVVAALSLVFWIGVIYFGRMIMYNATLLYSFGL
jgi:hypothetical protein